MAYDAARGRMVLHGGFDGKRAFADTWESDGDSWTRVSQTGPSPRAAHGVVFDQRLQRTLLYGGVEPPNRALGDTWAWDGERWTSLLDDGEGRTHLAMVYDPFDECVLRFGGKDSLRKPFGDMWQFDGRGWVIVEKNGPADRIDHALVVDAERNMLVLFGGKTPDPGGVVYGDTWEWAGGGWRQSDVPAAHPSEPSLELEGRLRE